MKRVSAKVHFLAGLFVIMAVIVCSPAASLALPTSYIDFNMDSIHPDGAAIYVDPTSMSLFGRNIGVDDVTGHAFGGSVTIPQIPIMNGRLEFTTGAQTSYGSNMWTFTGGTISIIGNVTAYIPGSSTTLLSGTLGTVTVFKTSNTYRVTMGDFSDTKDSALAKYFFGDNAPSSFTGDFSLSFLMAPNQTGAIFSSSSVGDGSVVNNVPLPGAIWLLGAGLVGLVGVRRRMIIKKKG